MNYGYCYKPAFLKALTIFKQKNKELKIEKDDITKQPRTQKETEKLFHSTYFSV